MARSRNKLTVVAIKADPDGALHDGGGLMFNRGKWIFRFSLAGRRRDMGLGSWPRVSLADARKSRDRWEAILASGVDPITERERLAKLMVDDPTLEEMVKRTFEAKKSGLRGAGIRGRWLSPLQTHILPKLGKRKILTLHQSDLRDALAPIWMTKSATAEKASQRLALVFKHARLSGLEVDPFTVEAARHLLGPLVRDVQPICCDPQ